MGRDGTSTLAVAPRGHYCGGGGIGHCRVVSESSPINPGIPMTSSANDLAASLFSRVMTGFVGVFGQQQRATSCLTNRKRAYPDAVRRLRLVREAAALALRFHRSGAMR